MIQIQKNYMNQLDRWCKNTEEDDDSYFQVFCERLEAYFEMPVYFDNRVAHAIDKLLKNFEYTEFTSQAQHEAPQKTRLNKIVRVLGTYEFMSMRYCQSIIKGMRSNYLKDKVAKFLRQVDEAKMKKKSSLGGDQISQTWKQTVQKNFQQTWTFLSSNKIYDEIILQLYDACLPLIKQYSIQKIQFISQYHGRVKKQMNQRNESAMILIDLLRPCCNEKKNKELSENINRFITERSLFLNKEKLECAYQQIKGIVATIKNGVAFSSTLTFELYGSMRTGFAIMYQSDGDINLIPNQSTTEMKRQEKIVHLTTVYNALRSNALGKVQYTSIEPYVKDKIRIPFVKLKFDNQFKLEKYSKNVLRSVDIVINSQNGIENSKILELYSKSQYIIKFGNFVKLWAKRKTLINTKFPTQGLSSYGVILMVLFYLIKTNQTPYVIQMNGEYRLQKNLLAEKDCLPMFDNFRGFLEFYKPNGRFFIQKMVVCLKENYIMNSFASKYVVPMHDFIDGSNPGRMSINLSSKFFNIINKTYIQLINYEDLREIIKYEQ